MGDSQNLFGFSKTFTFFSFKPKIIVVFHNILHRKKDQYPHQFQQENSNQHKLLDSNQAKKMERISRNLNFRY